MTANPKRFRNMTGQQQDKYRRNVMRAHRNLLLAHGIGMILIGLSGIALVAYHLITK